MITEKQLYEKINEEIKEYDEYLLGLDKEVLIKDAYEIAKTHEFYDFITKCIDAGNDYFCIEMLRTVVYKETEILASLCEFERNYNEPMWCNWDDIITVIENFAEANE